MSRSRTGDEGFSLSELMIVIGLLGVVLAAIYGVATAMIEGAKVNENQSTFSRESGEPVRFIEKKLMQAIRIESAGLYSITFVTDHNLDGALERLKMTATPDSRLEYVEWTCDSYGNNVSQRVNMTWSTHVDNVAQGVPLFTFLDENGAMIVDLGSAASAARNIRIDLVLKHEGKEYRVTKQVNLRNFK